jgi:hypothetical protein
MRYIVIKTDNVTQDVLDAINGKQVTKPTVIYEVEPDMENEVPGVASPYSYISTEEDYPPGFAGYRKLSQTEFDAVVQAIRSKQPVKNRLKPEVSAENSPFAAKKVDGRKIFKRIHGKEFTLDSQTKDLDFDIPYPECKITGLELVGAELGDKVDFKILDTGAGAISGISRALLNQFGFGVFINPDFHEEKSNYDADLIQDMRLKVSYTTHESSPNRKIYLNYIFHELK